MHFKRKKYFLIIGLVLSGFLFWLYNYLGGSQTLTFNPTHEQLYFQGEHFKGRHGDPKIEALFVNARAIALKKEGYRLAIINYKAPKDSVCQSIGIVAIDSLSDKSANFNYEEAIEGHFIKTTINAHNLVMPKPESVKQQAKEYAQRNNLLINEDRTIEVYHGERSLEVFIPVSENQAKTPISQ